MPLLLIALLLLPTTIFPKEKGSIHAILVYDTCSDLNSPVQKDVRHISIFLKEIERSTGIKVSSQTLDGTKLCAHALRSYLCSLDHHEIVFFYYSGHGHQSQSPLWPSLYFSSTKESFPVENILASFEKKPPRLTLLLFDCCNNSYPLLQNSLKTQIVPYSVSKGSSKIGLQQKHSFTPFSLKGPGLTSLLTKTEGTIVATGAEPGCASYAGAHGSLFTLAFLAAIKNAAPKKKPSWEQVLKETQLFCHPYQHPTFRIQK